MSWIESWSDAASLRLRNYKLTDALMLDFDMLNLAKRQRVETTRVPG